SASGSGTNAGSYSVIAAGTDSNYNLTLNNGTLTIGKADLTVTADDKSRLYGQANPTLTTTVSGFVNNETAGTAAGFTGAGSATTLAGLTTNVGTAVITAGAGNLVATNYAFTNLVNGILTINPAPLAEIINPPAGGILPAVARAIAALPGGTDLLPAFSSTVTVAATLVDVVAPPATLSNLQYVYMTTTSGNPSGDIDTMVDGEAVPTKAQGSKSDGFNERLSDAPMQFTGTVLVRNGGIRLPGDADDANK
ncbi:MAG: MBG domain-containing protein, partial [Gallionella sp.]|nr:MBG domain-containing protein [Gallionella sp.]